MLLQQSKQLLCLRITCIIDFYGSPLRNDTFRRKRSAINAIILKVSPFYFSKSGGRPPLFHLSNLSGKVCVLHPGINLGVNHVCCFFPFRDKDIDDGGVVS